MRTRSLVASAIGLMLALGPGCSSDDDGGGSTASANEGEAADVDEPDAAASNADPSNNDADAEFAHGMIPHHEQAVEMSRLAPDRAADERVLDLAGRIEAAQRPEIEQMLDWLEAWGEPHDPDSNQHGMDMGDGVAGMLSPGELTTLESAEGAAFDVLFLEGMIAHHEGALVMSDDELTDGQNADAIALAESIIASQEAEIEEMQDILADLT